MALALRWASPHSRQILDDLLSALPKSISETVRLTLAGFGQAIDEEEFTSVETIQMQSSAGMGSSLLLFCLTSNRKPLRAKSVEDLHFRTGHCLWAGVLETGDGKTLSIGPIRNVETMSLSDDRYFAAGATAERALSQKMLLKLNLKFSSTNPSLFEYLERLGAQRRGSSWILPFATSSWLMSCLRELTGKVQLLVLRTKSLIKLGWLKPFKVMTQ